MEQKRAQSPNPGGLTSVAVWEGERGGELGTPEEWRLANVKGICSGLL